MPLSAIFEAMDATAAAEDARLLSEARAAAEGLLTAAREDAATGRARALAEAAAAVRDARARLQADARVRGSTARADVREALVDQAFERAKRDLASARSFEHYAGCLGRLLREAAGTFEPEESLIVRCDPRDGALASSLVAQLRCSVTIDPTLDTLGGVIVHDKSGRVVADNTLERRLARAREVLWPEVARVAGLTDQP